MGADGHLLTIPVDRIPEQFADLDPERLDWRRRDFHGVDLLWSYHDTDGRGESFGLDFHEVPRQIEWLERRIEERKSPDFNWKETRLGRPRSLEALQVDLDVLRAKYSAEELALAERYDDFLFWLDANADDWTVWT